MRFALMFLWALKGFAAFQLTWGIPAISLDSNPPSGDSDINPSVALDSYGNAIAAWGRTSGRGATEDIWAASYRHSARIWTGALKISGGGNASNVSVAMDAEGNALLVWEEGFPTQIYGRVFSADGIWSPPLDERPFCVSESPYAQTFPQVGVDETGQALVIWMEYFQHLYHICSAHRTPGQNWKNLGALSSPEADAQIRYPTPLAMNKKGEAIAVWEEGGQEVWGARFLNGSWGSPFWIGKGREPSIALDSQSKGVIIWNEERLIQSRSILDGQLAPQVMTISNPHFPAQHPCVGIDGEGNAVAVYERLDFSLMHKFIAGARWKWGDASWTNPVDISAPSPAEVVETGYPLLSINSIGDGVVVWKEYFDERMVVQAAGYSLGTWASICTLSSKNEHALLFPGYDMGIAVNLAGNLVAVWPEDIQGNSTPHIRSVPGTGLAIAGPLPPLVDAKSLSAGIGKGYQEIHRFPAHADFINILDWTPPEGAVAYYKVYRGSLSYLIGTTREPHYEDHQRIPGKKETYLITAVDSHGHESVPMTILVPPVKYK